LALFVVGLLGAALIANFFHYLPPRVWFCLFCPAVAAAALFAKGEFAPSHEGGRSTAEKLAVAAAAVLILWQAGHRWGRADQRLGEERVVEGQLRDLRIQPDQLYVNWGVGLPCEHLVRPLDASEPAFGMKCVGIPFALLTPLTTDRLAEFGIDNLFQALYQRKDVYLIASEFHVKLFGDYVQHRYGERLGFRLVRRSSYSMAPVFNLTVLKSPGPAPKTGSKP